MSDDERIHYLPLSGDVSPCGVNITITPYTYASPEWSEVDCGDCRLEQPLAEPRRAPEYRVPQHVLDTDRALGLADELAAATRNLDAALKAVADAARLAEQSSAQVARIRTLLAEQALVVGPATPWHARAAAALWAQSKPGLY